jgi:hypothetical protein
MHEILVEELHRRPRSIVVVARGVAWRGVEAMKRNESVYLVQLCQLERPTFTSCCPL